MAFTAGIWDKNAVVCRALENRTGASVVQEFGLFDSWTKASNFANKLNEGLGLSEIESRQIVTESALRVSGLISECVPQKSIWESAPVLLVSNAIRVRCILARLRLALTFCASARHLATPDKRVRMIQIAQNSLDLSLELLPGLRIGKTDLQEACILVERLQSELRALSAATTAHH